MKSLLILPALLICFCMASAQNNFDIVQTVVGKISGTTNAAGDIHIFKGIPFAAPPVGNLRWREPQPVKPWDGVRKCTAFSASPMQGRPDEFGVYTREFLIPYEPISEDCLYLNVWTAAKSSAEKLPAIVWIYGGGFNSGGAAVPIYDGEATAKKGVIFVSINYRVGVFGFFAHPELTKESDHQSSGNYGLMDQLAALKWVQANISAFGGDPGNVTIAGQSAGSMSVNCLMASPLGKGLFQRAIAESGAVMIEDQHGMKTLLAAEQEGVKLAQSIGVNSLADLRNMPASALVGKLPGHVISDNYVLPKGVAYPFFAHTQNDVPLLTGWNADDSFLGTPKSAADYNKEINDRYGKDAADVLSYYPANSDEEAAISQIRMYRDKHFGIQNLMWANMQSHNGQGKVYMYRFNRNLPAAAAFKKYGAFHTGEVTYAYDNLKFLNRPWEPVDKQLAATMAAYWVNFAKNGNPNGKGLPVWPAFETHDYSTMMLNEKPHAAPLFDKDALNLTIKLLKKGGE